MEVQTRGMQIFIYNRVGFCSIWENIRARLVEPKEPGQDKTSPDFSPDYAEKPPRLHICHFRIQNYIFQNKTISTSCVNARSQPFPALGKPHSFNGNFIMNAHVAFFLPFKFSMKRYNDSTMMEILFLQLSSREKSNCL